MKKKKNVWTELNAKKCIELVSFNRYDELSVLRCTVSVYFLVWLDQFKNH